MKINFRWAGSDAGSIFQTGRPAAASRLIDSCRVLAVVLCLVIGSAAAGMADEADDLFAVVEGFGIELGGYCLGAELSADQKELARTGAVEAPSPATYKFEDNGLFVVADAECDRVLVIYRAWTDVTGQDVRDLTGDLFMAFDEPTVSAHDRLIYWAWVREGRLTSEAFEKAKGGVSEPLEIMATVKFSSEVPIMARDKEPDSGNAYTIISSAPLLARLPTGG